MKVVARHPTARRDFTIEEVYEPFLIQRGFIQRTPRGREATDLAYARFNKTKRKIEDQDNLFEQGE